MESGRGKRASLIWLELGWTRVSKLARSYSPFPGPGQPCLLPPSAKRTISLLMEESGRWPPAWPGVTVRVCHREASGRAGRVPSGGGVH